MIINYSDSNPIIDNKYSSIFLAGPTPRDKDTISWRIEALKIFKDLNYDGIIYVPELEHGGPLKSYDNQVTWERTCLENADCILFYIPRKIPEMMGLTTNVEFGMYLAKNPEKVLLGYPNDSEKNTYLGWLYFYEKKEIPYDNLNDLIKESIKLSKLNRREGFYDTDNIKKD